LVQMIILSEHHPSIILSAVALLMLCSGRNAVAFIPGTKGGPVPGIHKQILLPDAVKVAAPMHELHRSPESTNFWHSMGAAFASVAAAAALRKTGTGRRCSGSRSLQCVKLQPTSGTCSLTHGPVFLDQEGHQRGKLVARRSLKCCNSLYFKRERLYGDRYRRNLRNRAYNMFWKIKHKRLMKNVMWRVEQLELDPEVKTMDDVWPKVKAQLDNACITMDEICVQGVMHRNTVERRKDRLCRLILRMCIKKGILQKPEDPFIPAYKVLNYDMPICYKAREPRPWQLPGWKSPWMLKREYDQWKAQKEAQAA